MVAAVVSVMLRTQSETGGLMCGGLAKGITEGGMVAARMSLESHSPVSLSLTPDSIKPRCQSNTSTVIVTSMEIM